MFLLSLGHSIAIARGIISLSFTSLFLPVLILTSIFDKIIFFFCAKSFTFTNWNNATNNINTATNIKKMCVEIFTQHSRICHLRLNWNCTLLAPLVICQPILFICILKLIVCLFYCYLLSVRYFLWCFFYVLHLFLSDFSSKMNIALWLLEIKRPSFCNYGGMSKLMRRNSSRMSTS